MKTNRLFKDNCVLSKSELGSVSVGVAVGAGGGDLGHKMSPLQLLRAFRIAQVSGISLASIPGLASKLGKGGIVK